MACFAGAGVPAGQVMGQTDDTGAKPVGKEYYPQDIAATIYNKLGINHESFIDDIMRRPRPILPNGKLIKEVL